MTHIKKILPPRPQIDGTPYYLLIKTFGKLDRAFSESQVKNKQIDVNSLRKIYAVRLKNSNNKNTLLKGLKELVDNLAVLQENEKVDSVLVRLTNDKLVIVLDSKSRYVGHVYLAD